MKKSTKKLVLHRETVLQLGAMAKVAAGTQNQDMEGTSYGFTEPTGMTAFPCDLFVTWPGC
jgi:hypothetical protein